MKVSIIVPVYNVEKYLGKCLESLVHQTLGDIEIIVVNDGTKDHCQEIIDYYSGKYDNIISVKKENGGLSDARNYGMKYATGEFISFVDSDDYVEATMMEKMYDKAVNENIDIVVCDIIVEHSEYSYILKSNTSYTTDEVRAYICSFPAAVSRMVRKTVMDKFTFEKGIFYEDLNLTPLYVIETRKIGFVEEPLYYYVQREASIMNQKEFSNKLLDIFKVLEHVKNIYEEVGILTEFQNEVEYLYLVHLLRSATLRFLQYKDTKKYLIEINKIIKKQFPNWKKNPYFVKSNIKFKIICYLAYYRQYGLLKIINKFKK